MTEPSARTIPSEQAGQQAPAGTTTKPLPVEGGQYLALIVPGDEGEREAQAMENWLQACSSDEPFALELVGTRREQGFVLRASSQAQFTLLCKQLEAQYPMAVIQRIASHADPLVLRQGEHAMIGTFSLAQPSYLPLKTFPGKVLSSSGADPLAGLLAAMEAVGSGQRIIAQLALVRAPERWLAADIRKSVEHALQPERDRQAAALKDATTRSDTTEGLRLLGLLAAGGAGWLAYYWYQAHAWPQLIVAGGAVVIAFLAFFLWKMTRAVTPVYDMKLVADKMARAAFYSQLRVIVIGQERSSTRQLLTTHVSAMEVAYRQFTLASSNSLYLKGKRFVQVRVKPLLPPRVTSFLKQKRLWFLHGQVSPAQRLTHARGAFPYAHPLLRLLHSGAYSQQVLNSLEVSGLFHLPQETADLPLVQRHSLKGLLVSPQIAQQLKQIPAPLPPALIGTSRHRSFSVPVYLPFEALFSHKFFAGMSRSGKSVLIQLLAEAAMQPVQDASTRQPGLFVADPHRDLIMDLLKLVPPSRAQDVLLLDLTETQSLVALNPLDASMGFTRDQAVSNLMSSFQKIWAEQWGPRMAYFLNSVCLLLYTLNELRVQAGRAEEQYTLLDINPILQHKEYAQQVLSELDPKETWHQELLVFWQQTYFALKPAFKDEVIMPIISKIGVFNDNQQLRRIVGQPKTTAPIHEAVTSGKIVLCALSTKDMDENAVNILGSTLINLLHRSFALQQSLPLKERRKVFVAVDEFQHFSGGDFDTLLSEDTKYGCALLLATQNLKRLNKIRDGLLEMVLSNCQQLCVFRVSAADASVMEEEFQQKITVKHFLSQPSLHCYARLTLPGYPLQILSVALSSPASWHDDPGRDHMREEIRRASQEHARPVAEVDRLHQEHVRQFLSASASARNLKRNGSREKKPEDEVAEHQAPDEQAVQLQAAPLLSGTKQPTSPLKTAHPSGEGTDDHQEEHNAEAEAAERDKNARNHRHKRSRRMGKGSASLTQETLFTDRDADDHASGLPGSGGSPRSGGNSWGSSRGGYEGREGRERG